jgi:RecA/RadA recombinase
MAKDWLAKLQKLEGANLGNYNPHNHVIQTPSPSVNMIFGKGHGLPLGYGMVLYGVPKSGKSVLCFATTGQLHKDDPTAMVVKFDTEWREEGQLTKNDLDMWGIDPDRYISYSANSPMLIFDRIETEIAAMCQEGMPLKLVIIDSITGIQGRRAMNADTIETQQIGDHALTLQEGFKRILPIQRKHKFAIIANAHARAEMDMIEQKRGNKIKMAASFGVQHWAEYFVAVTDLSGNEMIDKELTDLRDKGDQTGHKITVKMKDSSTGPKGRLGEFSLSYTKGIVNQHEEIFLLGKNRGVLERPNNLTYVFGDRKFVGIQNMLTALKDEPELAKAILSEVYKKDAAGHFAAEDAKAENE